MPRLELDPDRTAEELFARLRGEPGADSAAGQLRTLHREVRGWRHLAARRLIFVPSLNTAEGLNQHKERLAERAETSTTPMLP